MTTNSNWTIVFQDKAIVKNNGPEAGTGYEINDDAFWNQSKFSNIWAIQHGTSVSTDAVEYKDTTPHSDYDSSVLGDVTQFINRAILITEVIEHYPIFLQNSWNINLNVFLVHFVKI